MPRSKTPVVSFQLAIASSGLLPSGMSRPSALPGSRPDILLDHGNNIFGAQSRGLHTHYTWLQTHPYGICMQVRYRFGGYPPLMGLGQSPTLTHWAALSSFTDSSPIPRIWVLLDTKTSCFDLSNLKRVGYVCGWNLKHRAIIEEDRS